MLYQCESYLLKAIRDFTTKYSVCRGWNGLFGMTSYQVLFLGLNTRMKD